MMLEMNNGEKFFYRLYIVIGILGIIIFLVFASNAVQKKVDSWKPQSRNEQPK
jgi:uncharacterized membrane protein YuzA (DUF378 family)